MKTIKFIFVLFTVFTSFSCKKEVSLSDAKCNCIQFKNQKCLKYFQTANTDPWGSWLQSNNEIEKRVNRFCDSLGVKTISIKIKDTKNRSNLIFECECSKTGKIICVKVNDNDADILKQHNFIDN